MNPNAFSKRTPNDSTVVRHLGVFGSGSQDSCDVVMPASKTTNGNGNGNNNSNGNGVVTTPVEQPKKRLRLD